MYQANLESVALPIPEIIANEGLGGCCEPPITPLTTNTEICPARMT